MQSESHPRAEEALRLLASAVNTARLYPPSSALPAQAATRFASRANEITASVGSLRYVVEPHGFTVADGPLASGFSQTTQLAEILYALQVGQLIIAPGVTESETLAFVETVRADPLLVLRAGGVRSRLVSEGVEHLGVIEVTLRSSEEEGILGMDLTSVQLSDIAGAVVASVETWARTAAVGEGEDQVATATGRLEQATRNIALTRVSEALLRLDESTRMKVLAWSLRADTSGNKMQGMLQVLARMRPAALARLLSIVAERAGTVPELLSAAIELPPDVASEVGRLLGHSARSEADCGVPASVDHAAMALEAAVDDDGSELLAQIAAALPSLATGKALTAAVAVSRRHPDADSVRSIAAALPQSARDGAFASARAALHRLEELGTDPALTESVANARTALADPQVLSDVCRAPMEESDAAVAGEILSAAGATGAEVLVNYYDRTDDGRRALMQPVLRGMSDSVLGVANRRLRGSDALASVIALRTLPALGDARAVESLLTAMQDVHTEVRLAAVRALADTPGADARMALTKVLTHWDPETQRLAIREIGRVRAVESVPTLVRSLETINSFRANHDIKKEIVRTLAQVGSPEALPALKRIAKGVALGRKAKELRLLAQRAILTIEQQDRPSRTASSQVL